MYVKIGTGDVPSRLEDGQTRKKKSNKQKRVLRQE